MPRTSRPQGRHGHQDGRPVRRHARRGSALIYNRNADWLRLMPAIMQARPTLFVVGAGHLPGDRGVLEGLRKMGYKVE